MESSIVRWGFAATVPCDFDTPTTPPYFYGKHNLYHYNEGWKIVNCNQLPIKVKSKNPRRCREIAGVTKIKPINSSCRVSSVELQRHNRWGDLEFSFDSYITKDDVFQLCAPSETIDLSIERLSEIVGKHGFFVMPCGQDNDFPLCFAILVYQQGKSWVHFVC